VASALFVITHIRHRTSLTFTSSQFSHFLLILHLAMAPLLDNPNNAILPDFSTQEHEPARARLIGNGVADDAQAAGVLAALWTLSNDAAKDVWAEQIQEADRAATLALDQAAEQERQRQQALQEEQEAALKEEHKKNKSKFFPVSTAKVPSHPVIIPSHYAVRKLKAGDYCELHYFTNKGLHEAKTSLLSTEPDGLVMMPAANGQQTWVHAGAIRDPKSVITKDENLSWEEFNEAAPRMITAMKLNDWPEDRVLMHVQFWTALQNHRWRHSFDELQRRALLLYQSQQRRLWHLTAGTLQGWSIAELNHELILEAREEIFNLQRTKALASLSQVCSQ
jgi:ribosomal protein S15P/S13E